MAKDTVLVTGSNGFIGLHIIGKLLKKGYNVVGTVRSQDKADDIYRKFKIDKSDPKLKIYLVKDIIKAGAFDDVLKREKDIKYILHTASPFKFGFTDNFEEGYRAPAVQGTLNALKAIQKYGENVITVVVTSSFASIMNLDKFTDPKFVHNENTWNPITWDNVQEEQSAYCASKKLAEEAAWTFVKENDVKFNLVTVCPPYVFGPQYFDEDAATDKLNTSNEVINNMLNTDPNDTSFFSGTNILSVDVRDVANFHILAFERGIKNQRLLPSGETVNEQKILNIMNEYIPQLSGKIAKGSPSKAYIFQSVTASSEKSKQLLGGYEYIPLKDQVADTVRQFLDAHKK